MSFVYLIGEYSDENRYKIGVTKKNVENRKNKLQTRKFK